MVLAVPPAEAYDAEYPNRIIVHDVDGGEVRLVETTRSFAFDDLAWIDDEHIVLLERFCEPQRWRVRPDFAVGPQARLRRHPESTARFTFDPHAPACSANGRYVALYSGAG